MMKARKKEQGDWTHLQSCRGNHSFQVITLLMTNGPLFMGCQFQAHDAANSTAQCKSHLCYHYFFPSFLAQSDQY